MNIRYPIYEGVYRILTFGFTFLCSFRRDKTAPFMSVQSFGIVPLLYKTPSR